MAFSKNDPNINRNGRPKKGQSLTEILLQKISKEEIARLLITMMRAEIECPECGASIEIPKDNATLRFVYNHIDGMPTQKNILSTDDEEPFTINVREIKSK